MCGTDIRSSVALQHKPLLDRILFTLMLPKALPAVGALKLRSWLMPSSMLPFRLRGNCCRQRWRTCGGLLQETFRDTYCSLNSIHI